MEEPSSFATNRRVGCIMGLAILALLISSVNLLWNVIQEFAWNERVEQATAYTSSVTAQDSVPLPASIDTTTPNATSISASTSVPPETQLDSADLVLAAFRSAGLPISDIVAYTAETDLNSLLGRPHQYIAKVDWKDTRITAEGGPGIDTGGTIEVFMSVDDLQARKQYVESVSKMASFAAEYAYANGLLLLRLSHELTPEQAKTYEDIFMALP